MNEQAIVERLEAIKREIEIEMDTARENIFHTEKYLIQQIDYVIRDLKNEIDDRLDASFKEGILKAASGE